MPDNKNDAKSADEIEEIGWVLGAQVSEAIDQQISRVSSSGLLGLGIGALALSVGLAASGERRRGWAAVVGSWVPALVGLAVYSKILEREAEGRREAPVLHH